MSTITAKDGTTVYYKDCGPKDVQPVVFHHGWPLSSDDTLEVQTRPDPARPEVSRAGPTQGLLQSPPVPDPTRGTGAMNRTPRLLAPG